MCYWGVFGSTYMILNWVQKMLDTQIYVVRTSSYMRFFWLSRIPFYCKILKSSSRCTYFELHGIFLDLKAVDLKALLQKKFSVQKTYSNVSRDFYNWTMTFRRDSDILDSYGAAFVAKIGENPALSSYTYKLRPKGLLKST